MRRIILLLTLVLLLCPCSYGAVSEDASVYVRQDVFDAKMEAFMAEIRLMNEQIRHDIQEAYVKAHEENQEMYAKTHNEIAKTHDAIRELGSRVAVIEGRMSSLEIMIYWVLGTLAIVFAVAAVVLAALTLRPQIKETPMPSFTLDDVKRLIAEAKLGGVPQV